ncbi:MAG TPA: leucine-rich repeat protein [Candidatus Limiplasma sp.]|nr:leucine-rich repeat protein [Candidatus Limiplasma sp.]HRX07866.1 leucine-rich repeat protein [Candidatus Limiplasma sp.]
MGDKKRRRKQLERLAEITRELEERELVLSRETRYLEELKTELDERERRLVAAGEAMSARAIPAEEPAQPNPVYRERPLSQEQPEQKPVQKPSEPSTAKMVAEMNGIVKSVFWDYSSNIRRISSQMSTVTAAMLCAAVTSMLENRGFDMKDVFVREMERVMENGDFTTVAHASAFQGKRPAGGCPPAPEAAAETRTEKPAPVPESVATPQAEQPVPAPEPADQPAMEPAENLAPEPTPEPAPAWMMPDDGEDEEATADTAAPEQPEGEILRIGSVIEFQKLGDRGFRNDYSITRVQLPEGIQYLPNNFFYGCSNLKEIWLPDSLLEIGSNSFYGCTSLASVHIGEKSALREIGEYAFALCESLVSFTVPAKVQTLGTSVFRFCASLQKLRFAKDSSLRTIGSHLLQNCTSLEKIHLPDSIAVIPTSMCYGCASLRRVVAHGAHTIEDYAFYGNISLRTVSMSHKKIIASQAFEGCDPALVIEYLND